MRNKKKSQIKKHGLALGFLFLLLLTFFGPVLFSPQSRLLASPGDPLAVVWDSWWRTKAENLGQNPLHIGLLNAPQGVDLSGESTIVPWKKIADLITLFGGEVLAYNLTLFLYLSFAVFAFYDLVFYITKNHLLSVFGGGLLLFSPFVVHQSLQHLGLVTIGWIILFILYLLKTIFEKKIIFIFPTALFWAFASLEHFFFAYMGMIIFAVSLFFVSIWKRDAFLKLILAGLLALSIFLPFNWRLVLPVFTKDTSNLLVATSLRSETELKTYSATFKDYFLPPPTSFLWGKKTAPLFEKEKELKKTNLFENALYLGWPIIILAGVGFWTNRKKKIGFFFLGLSLLGFLLSFAPEFPLGTFSFKTPGYYLFQLLPYFRVSTRLGLLVFLSLLVLACLGIDFLLKKTGGGKKKLMVMGLLFVVGLDLLSFPKPFTLAAGESSVPPVYRYLKNLPDDFVLAEYPLLPAEEPLSYDYLFWQRIHQKPLVNGAPMGTVWEGKRKELVDIQGPQTIAKLKERNVKYILIHEDRYTPENAQKYPQEYNGGEKPKIDPAFLDLVADFGADKLYQIK